MAVGTDVTGIVSEVERIGRGSGHDGGKVREGREESKGKVNELSKRGGLKG